MIDSEKLINAVNKLIQFLNEVDSAVYYEQINYLNFLIDLIKNKQYETFFVKANSSELWGGSGSIWESEYGMSEQQRQIFENTLLDLLNLLKENNKMDKRAKSVFKILNRIDS